LCYTVVTTASEVISKHCGGKCHMRSTYAVPFVLHDALGRWFTCWLQRRHDGWRSNRSSEGVRNWRVLPLLSARRTGPQREVAKELEARFRGGCKSAHAEGMPLRCKPEFCTSWS